MEFWKNILYLASMNSLKTHNFLILLLILLAKIQGVG
jgi:hypothetical protein